MGGDGPFSAGGGRGQALSFAQRSLLKENVIQGRFSQSQCLGTLCLKGRREEQPRGKTDRSFLHFLLFIRLILEQHGFDGDEQETEAIKRRF